MRIVFMGTPDFAAESLNALIESRHEVVAAVTKEDKPVGRGKKLRYSPVKEIALAHDIPVLQPGRASDDAFFDALRGYAPDLIVVVAFGQIIPARILELPPHGCINVHASLLPAYRGAAPIQWAVIDGVRTSGVTIMQMDEGLDTGDILSRREVALAEDETGGSLFDKLAASGAELLVETIERIEAGLTEAEPQPAESTTPYARMISKRDGRIDWSRDAASIERLVRGMSPWPSAYTNLEGRTLKIWKAEVVPDEEIQAASGPDGGAGTVAGVSDAAITVQTGSGALRILELQAEGKRRMTVDAYLRGNRISAGMRFAADPDDTGIESIQEGETK